MSAKRVLLLGGQGYVGSALAGHLLGTGFDVQSVDVGLRGTPGPAPNALRRYQDLTADEFAGFQSVVLLAGHSTVSACSAAPTEAFANNVCGFVDLIHKLRNQQLIYASSISVYVRTPDQPANEDDPLPEPVATYDLHKQTIERYARFAYPNSYGLRFGTVCGASINLRPELLLNGLVRSAICQGQVQVANPHAHRPILGINDLCLAVEMILTHAVPPACYNLASTNVRIGELAQWVARRFSVPLVEVEGKTPYDIRVSTEQFRTATGMEFRDTIESLAETLAAHYIGEPL
jgi:nucleoside-diphosphate-sugar epimerase